MRHPAGEGSSGVGFPGKGREGLFVPGQPRFGYGFMVPSGRCGTGGPSWHRPRAGKGAPGHSEKLPPSCYLAPKGQGPQVGMSQVQSDEDLVKQELAPFHGWGRGGPADQ